MKYNRTLICVKRVNQIQSYVKEHAGSINLTDTNIEFPIQQYKNAKARDIIRIQYQSAHKKAFQYYTYIRFDSNQVLA